MCPNTGPTGIEISGSSQGILVGKYTCHFCRIKTASFEVPTFLVNSQPNEAITRHSSRPGPDGGMEYVSRSRQRPQPAIWVSQSGRGKGLLACAIGTVQKEFPDPVL